MKAVIALGIGFFLALSQLEVKAQIISKVTRITSTTASGGTVMLEDSANKDAVAIRKGTFYVRTKGYSNGTVLFADIHTPNRIFWQGPVAGIKIAGYATDSLKILYLRQYMTN